MKRLAIAGLGLLATPLLAQNPPAPPAPQPPVPQPLAVGVEAPDFSLPAATSAGLSSKPFVLREHRGKTVVLAFFFKARTSG
ncbi:MAG: hypothetical protein ACT4PM_07225 [Gemmatimonadales bacterium]